MKSRYTVIASLLVLAVVIASAPAQGGEIVGKVKYAGTAPAPKKLPVTKDQAVCGKVEHIEETLLVGADKGIKNVVVKVADPKDGKKAAAPAKNPAIDQNGCRFVPRVQIIPAGVMVDIINSDGILHNIHTWSKDNTPFNKAQPKFKKVMNEKFEKPEIFRISCDVHSWMSGWLVVAAHPYYALTSAEGAFTISDVPAGTYTLEYWHEKLGKQTKQVTVPATGSVTADFEYAAK
jgi:plastocyanin